MTDQTLNNVTSIHSTRDPVPTTEVPTPKLQRLEAEARMLSALLDAGVESWDGYALALDTYRAGQKESGE